VDVAATALVRGGRTLEVNEHPQQKTPSSQALLYQAAEVGAGLGVQRHHFSPRNTDSTIL